MSHQACQRMCSTRRPSQIWSHSESSSEICSACMDPACASSERKASWTTPLDPTAPECARFRETNSRTCRSRTSSRRSPLPTSHYGSIHWSDLHRGATRSLGLLLGECATHFHFAVHSVFMCPGRHEGVHIGFRALCDCADRRVDPWSRCGRRGACSLRRRQIRAQTRSAQHDGAQGDAASQRAGSDDLGSSGRGRVWNRPTGSCEHTR